MVCSTQNYWRFWTLSIVWYSKKHNVSETGPVSVLKFGRDTYSVGFLRANLNHPVILSDIRHHQNPLESTCTSGMEPVYTPFFSEIKTPKNSLAKSLNYITLLMIGKSQVIIPKGPVIEVNSI
jgi:hypothetical protein